MSMTFSQFLLRNGYVSNAELEEASQATVLFGGRLGSAAVELGLLTPEQLDSALARHHGVREIPKEWLSRPDAGARAALHLDLMRRHRVFPLNFERRSLHVGMLDPHDQDVLEKLAFASGCAIVPYALAEFRFFELMQRIYGVAPSARFKNLLHEGARARAMRSHDRDVKQAAEEQQKRMESLEFGPLDDDGELSDHDAYLAAGTQLAPSSAASASEPPRPVLEVDGDPGERAAPPSLEALEQTLADSAQRAEVIQVGTALAARFAAVAALFVIRNGSAAGLAAQRGESPLDVDALAIPLAPASVLATCSASKAPVRAAPQSELDRQIAKALGSDERTELAVFPISIGGRVVNLLVAQPAAGPLGVTAQAALAALAPQIAAAYERLILAQKQKAQGSSPALPEPVAKAPLGALPLLKRVVRVPVTK